MAQEVATQEQGQGQQLAERAEIFKREVVLARDDIEKMLPKHVEFDRFQGMVVSVVSSDPYLLKCTKNSLLRSVIDAADTGLSLNKMMREADILPTWDNKIKGYVAQFRPRAIGLMKLARQSGAVKKITAHEIYENDHFDVQYGLDEKLEHKPTRLGHDKGPIIGAYCAWILADGTPQFEVIDMQRIERSRGASESYKRDLENKSSYSPWSKDFGEMVRKTAIKAASKYFPLSNTSDAFLRALGLENEVEGEFTEIPQIEEPNEPSSAAQSQVASLEQRLGAEPIKVPGDGGGHTGGAGPTQVTAPAAEASGRGRRAATRNSKSAPPPSDTSSQEKSQSGTATTASPSELPPREEPPLPNDPDDYGNIPTHMRRQQPEQAQQAQPTQPAANAPKPGYPMQDLIGDEPKVRIDWKAKAREVYNALMLVQDIPSYKAFNEKNGPLLTKMKTEAPDWWQRLNNDILGKEEWLRG